MLSDYFGVNQRAAQLSLQFYTTWGSSPVLESVILFSLCGPLIIKFLSSWETFLWAEKWQYICERQFFCSGEFLPFITVLPKHLLSGSGKQASTPFLSPEWGNKCEYTFLLYRNTLVLFWNTAHGLKCQLTLVLDGVLH